MISAAFPVGPRGSRTTLPGNATGYHPGIPDGQGANDAGKRRFSCKKDVFERPARNRRGGGFAPGEILPVQSALYPLPGNPGRPERQPW